MKFPKNKGFDLACGVVITIVLDTVLHDKLVTLTGTFLGEIQEKHHDKRGDNFHEFILIQLACPFCERGGLEIPEGTLCLINVDQILFIIPGMKCNDKKHDDICDEKDHDKKHIINISCNREDNKKDNSKWDDK